MHVIYTDQTSGFEPGVSYSNPRYFERLRPGATSVTVIGDYPAIVSACDAAGIPCKIEGVAPKPVPTPAPVKSAEPDAPLKVEEVKREAGKPITIERGPRGFWFHIQNGERVSKGFASEQEAKSALSEVPTQADE